MLKVVAALLVFPLALLDAGPAGAVAAPPDDRADLTTTVTIMLKDGRAFERLQNLETEKTLDWIGG